MAAVHALTYIRTLRGEKMKQALAVVFTLSLVLLGGCETTASGSSNRESPRHVHQH
jgi:hypothetical protein